MFEDKAALTFVLNRGGELQLLNPDRRTTFVQKKQRADSISYRKGSKPSTKDIIDDKDLLQQALPGDYDDESKDYKTTDNAQP